MMRWAKGYAALGIAIVALVVALINQGPRGASGEPGPQGAAGLHGERGEQGLAGRPAADTDDVWDELDRLTDTMRYLCASLGESGRERAEADFKKRLSEWRAKDDAALREQAKAMAEWERKKAEGELDLGPAFVLRPSKPTRGDCE